MKSITIPNAQEATALSKKYLSSGEARMAKFFADFNSCLKNPTCLEAHCVQLPYHESDEDIIENVITLFRENGYMAEDLTISNVMMITWPEK